MDSRRTYTIAFTPRQYRSHIGRKRGWPPRSQLGWISEGVQVGRMGGERKGKGKGKGRKDTYHFRVTWPFCTRLVLKPIVGMELGRLVREGEDDEVICNLLDSELPTLHAAVSTKHEIRIYQTRQRQDRKTKRPQRTYRQYPQQG